MVLASAMTARYRKSSPREGGYTPVVEPDSLASEEEEEDEDDIAHDARMSSSQTLVDPTNLPAKALIDGEGSGKQRRPLNGLRILLLALPAVCDICGTTLMNVGLLFVAASIYQMTRGALVLFVGLFSVIFLKRYLGLWKWISLFVVVTGVAIVGLAGALEGPASSSVVPPGNNQARGEHPSSLSRPLLLLDAVTSTQEAHTAGQTVIGVLMIAGAQIFTASQFVLEESIMEHYSMDPIQVVGWEGVFGTLVTLLGMGVLHLAVGSTPRGRGGYFDAREGFNQMFHNRAIAVTSLLIMISIGQVHHSPQSRLS